MDLTKEAIDKIVYLADKANEPTIIEIGGREILMVGGRPQRDGAKALPNALRFEALDSLVAYIKGGYDTPFKKGSLFLHIISPTRVELKGEADPVYATRGVLAYAEPELPGILLNQWISIEQFIIMLQYGFVQTKEVARVIECCAGIKVEDGQDFSDDGVSQTVTVKSGVSMVKRAALPNPVMLAPFRTFSECEQPESRFLLRLTTDKYSDGPQLGLYDADGGAWRVSAMKCIKAYLDDMLEGACEVLA